MTGIRSNTTISTVATTGATMEHDTQRLFEEYWQRGKYDGKPLVLDPSIFAQTPRGLERQTDGGSGGLEDTSESGKSKDQTAATSKDKSTPAGNPPSSGNEGSSNEPPPEQTKAQMRRAQVRRAQIQHRKRKADYTKHLEMESAKYRDLVEQTQRETYALETENEKMRQMLVQKLGYLPPQAITSPFASNEVGDAMAWEATDTQLGPSSSSERSNSASSIPGPVYSVSVAMSETMGTPAIQVRRTSSPTQISSRSGSMSKTPTSRTGSVAQPAPIPETVVPTDIITSLSEEQTDRAINFILGLEHICWDHWDRSYFTHESYDETGCMHGHALMASTIALQAAPVEVFSQLEAVGEYLRSNPLPQEDRSEHGKCDHDSAPVPSATRSPQSGLTGGTSRGSLAGQSGTSGGETSHATEMDHTPRTSIPMLENGNNISWPATGLSLETLHALASKLSPPETELAPVQAWFEILREYGVAVVLNQQLMAQVLAEFSGVVKCLHFGAVIERDAFDSVVSRVIAGAQWS